MYEKITDKTIQCDLCGGKSPQGEIYKSDHSIYLCPRCMKKIATSPNKIKESLERFLLGEFRRPRLVMASVAIALISATVFILDEASERVFTPLLIS